jgi:hypothetical protein
MTAAGEIVDGKPHIHAVMAAQGDRTIGGHPAHIHTSFARAYVIPSDHRVAVPADEHIVFEQIPDEGPSGRGRINDTRVGLGPQRLQHTLPRPRPARTADELVDEVTSPLNMTAIRTRAPHPSVKPDKDKVSETHVSSDGLNQI